MVTEVYLAYFGLFGGDTYYKQFEAPSVYDAMILAEKFGKENDMTFFGIQKA